MQLKPKEWFVIMRQLDDPTLTDTYYVRAYIKKSRTDALIDTVDLTDKGSYRFTKEWQVPGDQTGEGFFIDIETRVFTDAAYTTESTVFRRENNQYLVMERMNPAIHFGGGGGVDYKKVREIVKEEIEKIPPLELPPEKRIDFKPILEAIEDIEVSPIIKTEKVDLGGVIRLIERVRMLIEDLPEPKPPEKVDFSGIEDKLDKLSSLISEGSNASKKEIDDKTKEILDEMLKEMKKYSFVMARIEPPKEEPKNAKSWRKNY